MLEGGQAHLAGAFARRARCELMFAEWAPEAFPMERASGVYIVDERG